jgi:Ca2+/Na+ antiporter
MLVNTTITFISRQPIHELRSVLLTLLNVLNVGLAYGVIYAAQRESFDEPLSALQAVYFSFVTLTTLGYGDIRPGGVHAWAGQVTVILELMTALYLLAAVLTVVVSWAQRRW